jgi:hypothetical protein
MERHGGGWAVALRAATGIAGVSRMGESKRVADRERAFEDIVNEKYVVERNKSICMEHAWSKSFVAYDVFQSRDFSEEPRMFGGLLSRSYMGCCRKLENT